MKIIIGYLPKGTKKTTKQFVAYIESWMNNYPRKIFNFKSYVNQVCLMDNFYLQFEEYLLID